MGIHGVVWRVCLGVGLWGVLGCATAPPRGDAALPADASTPQLRALLDEVATARGLPWRVRPRVVLLDAAAWEAAVAAQPAPLFPAALDSVGVALGFFPAPHDGVAARANTVVAPAALLARQGQVVLWPRPEVPLPLLPGGEMSVLGQQVRVLARALAMQHAAPPPGDRAPLDAQLAHAAVLEADATLTMLAVLAARRSPSGTPVSSEQLAALGQSAARLEPGQLVAAHGLPRALLDAPMLVLDLALLPHREALALLSLALGEGGPALRNAVLQHPPPTTEAILSPARYAAGDAAIPVRAPELGKAWRTTGQHHVGALGLRAMLGLCHPQELAQKAVAGFGGDVLVTAEKSGGGTPVAVWILAMDEERPARVLEFLLSRMEACLTRRAMAGAARELGPVTVHRVGKTVVFARGLGPKTVGERLAGFVGGVGSPPPPRPPLGERTLGGQRLLDPEERARHGQLKDGTWTSMWAGLQGAVPAGFTADLERPGVLLLLQRQDGTPAVLTLAWVRGGVDPSLVDGLLATMAQRFSYGGPALAPLPRDGQQTRAGLAVRQRFLAADSGGTFTILLLPACDGHAAVAVTVYAQDQAGAQPLEAFVDGLEANPAAPACAAR